MTQTTIRGFQLRDASLPRTKLDPAFEGQIASIEANIASIFNTMSTDAERMAAVEALTIAFQSADGTLQGMITTLVNATKAGAGLEADGSFALPAGQNFLTGATSLKGALGLLDAALKTEADARAAADADLQTNIQAIINAGGAQAAADLAAEVTAREAADAANATAIANEVAARTAADADLQSVIDAEALARTTADAVHTASIADEVAARTAADTAEATARIAGDDALDARVNTLEKATTNQMTYANNIKRETPVGLINGVNTLFTLAFYPVLDTEEVFVNGQLQDQGATADYTINGKEITLTYALEGTDKIRVNYFR